MKRVVLVGNPNAGKTTLYNSLTGKKEKVGNWHGVTVQQTESEFTYKNQKITLVDLPGLYTLKGSSAEEKEAERFLNEKNYDLIILILETKKFEKTLYLLYELKCLNKPIIVFFNLYADFLRKKGKIDEDKASEELGLPCIFGEAVGGVSIKKLKDKILENNLKPKVSKKEISFFTPEEYKSTFQKLFFNGWFAVPFFILIMTFIFWFSFGKNSPTGFISEGISRLVGDKLSTMLHWALIKVCSPFIAGLISDGIIRGISSVLEFMPQVLALSFCLDFLDQSGYVSILSATLDDMLGKVGLSGRATYTLLSGFGCTAISGITANGIYDVGVKKRTLISLPFISCSAKTPVYFYLVSSAFGKYSFLIITSIYFLSIIASFTTSFLLLKFKIKSKPENYVEEIPSMRLPNFRTLLKSLQKTALSFIIKLSSIIFLVSASIWILKSITIDFKFIENGQIENSILSFLGKGIAFIFYPLGIKDWRYSVAFLSGIFAKEGIASTLSILFPTGLTINLAQRFALVIFVFAYTPCLSALASLKGQLGFVKTLKLAVYQLIVGLLASYATYFLFNL